MGTTIDFVVLIMHLLTLLVLLIPVVRMLVHGPKQHGQKKRAHQPLVWDSMCALDELAEPVIFIKDHVITYANRATLTTFAYRSLADIVGKSETILMDDSDAAQHPAFIQRYESTGVKKVIGKPRGTSLPEPCY